MKIDRDEYVRLCEQYTATEIAEIMDISNASVTVMQRETKVKPKRVCSRCGTRFEPVRNEQQCPECQKTRVYKYPALPVKKPYRKPRKSKAFQIEKQMRKQGKNYADYQKERTIAEYARVKL